MTTYLLPYTAGTVTTNGTTTVTGALTAWLANVKPGDRFRIGTSSGIVASVESNTSLTLESAWSGSASGQSYAIDRWSRGWFSGGDLALALALYNTNRPTFIPTTGQPSDAVGSDGNVAFDASANIFFKKTAGAWDSGTSIIGLPGEITRSGSQTGGLAKFVSDTEIGQATAQEAADLIGSPRGQMFNLFEDGGRFADNPEATSSTIGAFAAPGYLSSYNGSAFTQGDKFIQNNSTYGGTAGALGADVDALVTKWYPNTAYRRYGPEFYVLNITAGAGTSAPTFNDGTDNLYLSLANRSAPIWPNSTLNYWTKVVSGKAGVLLNYGDWYKDGVKQTANFTILPADGWVQLTLQMTLDAATFVGYASDIFRLFATPNSVMRLASPCLFPGALPMSPGLMYRRIPSLRAWR